MESSRKRMSICGTKPSTAPTPATMPSMTRPESQGATFQPAKSVVSPPVIHSPKSVSFMNPTVQSPTLPMEM